MVHPGQVRWTGIALVILAAGGIILAVVWPRMSGTRSDFAEPAEAVLRRLGPGPTSPDLREVAGEVYDQSSATLREVLARDRFIDRFVQMNHTLGALRTVRAVLAEEQFASRAGDAIRVDLDLEFERARTTGSVAYVRRKPNEPYRLLGVEVTIPESRSGFAQTVVPTYIPIKTPRAVMERMHGILRDIQDGKEREVYQKATDTLRDGIGLEQFLERIAADKQALGSYRRILSAESMGISMDQARFRLFALVEFDRARAPVTMEFWRGLDLRKNQPDDLQLMSYRLVIPEPIQPRRAPAELRP